MGKNCLKFGINCKIVNKLLINPLLTNRFLSVIIEQSDEDFAISAMRQIRRTYLWLKELKREEER